MAGSCHAADIALNRLLLELNRVVELPFFGKHHPYFFKAVRT